MAKVAERLKAMLERSVPCGATRQTLPTPGTGQADTKTDGKKIEKLRSLLENTECKNDPVGDRELVKPKTEVKSSRTYKRDGHEEDQKDGDEENSAANLQQHAGHATGKDRNAIEKLRKLLEGGTDNRDSTATAPDLAQGSPDDVDPEPELALEPTSSSRDEVIQEEANVAGTTRSCKVATPQSVYGAYGGNADHREPDKIGPTCDKKPNRERHATGCSVTFSENVQVIPSLQGNEQPESDVQSQPAKIPKRRLERNVCVEVVVVGFSSQLIYVHELSALEDLVKMMKVLNTELVKYPILSEAPEPKTYVAVLRRDDRVWYRAYLTAVKDDGADAFFIDYGKRETVGLESLKALPEAFYDIPAFAMSVRPQGIDRIDVEVGICLQGQVFEAEAIETSGKRRTVMLYTKEGGQCINEVLKELSDIAN